jgi:hypothetical protein
MTVEASMKAALISLWNDGTKWAELFGAIGMLGWGGLNLISPVPPTEHAFGTGMGWITRVHLEEALVITGVVQSMAVLFGNRLSRILTAGPAAFLTLDIVVDVIMKGDFPYGSIAFFATAALMNFLSITRNGERMHAESELTYG